MRSRVMISWRPVTTALTACGARDAKKRPGAASQTSLNEEASTRGTRRSCRRSGGASTRPGPRPQKIRVLGYARPPQLGPWRQRYALPANVNERALRRLDNADHDRRAGGAAQHDAGRVDERDQSSDRPRIAFPSGWLLPRECVCDLEAILAREHVELRPVDDLLERARAVEEPSRRVHACSRAMAQHRHERHDAGSASHEKDRTTDRPIPDEVPADRPADFETITDDDGVQEEGRHLAIRDPLDRDVDLARALGLRRDRVAPLRRVSVLRGEADV